MQDSERVNSHCKGFIGNSETSKDGGGGASREVMSEVAL